MLIPAENGAPPHPLLVASLDQPTAVAYLYEVFAELNLCRKFGIDGPEPLGYNEIIGFQQASGFRLRDWERQLLLSVDVVWRSVHDKDYPGPKLKDD